MKHVIGILLGLLAVSVGANVYQLICPLAAPLIPAYGGPRAVYAEETPQRLDVWYPKRVPLGETGYEAHAGPWVFPRPQVYTVSVERPFPGGSRTLFERAFRVDELPDGFLDWPVGQVVSFDPATRTVTFTLGGQRLDYCLPTADK